MNLATGDFWFGSVAGSLVATAIWCVVVLLLKLGIRDSLPFLCSIWRLHRVLHSTRMVAFNRSRDDYGLFHPIGSSVDAYIGTAKKQLVMVSISLKHAIESDNLCQALKELLLRPSPVDITISLLNPLHEDLMESVARSLAISRERLMRDIRTSMECLSALHGELETVAAGRLHLRVHNSVPSASAILVDPHEADGRIQLEAKPYKAGTRSSYGFELRQGGSSSFYRTLLQSYTRLVEDGMPISE